jgi:predicted permease
VAHDFLDVLGVRPILGRGFTAEEGVWDGPPVVILSHGFWQRRFAADPAIVGSAITIDQRPHTVVGVLPPSFDFSSVFAPGVEVDFLMPFAVSAETDAWGNTMFMVGRLRQGVTAEVAQAELDAIVAALREEQPRRWGLGARVRPLREHIAGPFRSALLLLAAAAGTLVLIACVNVSNLALARSPARRQELAVRKAFGAPLTRLARQLVLETVAVSVVGAALGSVLAWAATRWIAGASAIRIPLLDQVRVDGSTLAFAGVVAFVSGLVAGLVPALQVRDGSEASTLRESGRGSSATRSSRRLREGLVVAEVTLACVLLVVGGQLVRSFRAVLDVELGFDPSNAVAWQIDPSESFSPSWSQPGSLRAANDFYSALVQRVAEVQGVERVGLIDGLPLRRNRSWVLNVVGAPETSENGESFLPHVIDPGYLEAMKVPVLAGRNFSRLDTEESTRVVLMNESGARRVFAGENPLGQRIRGFSPVEWEVVGITQDVKHVSPEMDPGTQVYFPIAQMPDFQTLDLVVRSELPAEQIGPSVAAALSRIDPSMPTREYWTLRSTVDRVVSARRFTLGILTTYGIVALVLAGLGVYGVLAQSVAERKPEIGIRIALGASASGIVWSVMRRTLLLAALGILAGAVIALTSARLWQSLLFGISAQDPITFAGMALTLFLVASLAGAIPAARAARTRGTGLGVD